MSKIFDRKESVKALKGYEMKAVKSFQGHDGDVLGGNLYYNNRLVARAANDSWGGPMNIEVKNEAQYNKFCKICRALPPIPFSSFGIHDAGKPVDNRTLDVDEELVMDEMMCKVEEDKHFKRLCKTKIVIITTDCTHGEVITINRKYDNTEPVNHKKQLKMKYGKELVEIINERFL